MVHFKAFINLSQVFKGKGQKEHAVLAASRAAELQPESFVAMTNLALILADSGQLGAAEKYAHKAVALDGQSAYGHLVLATILGKRGRMEATEAAALSAIQLDPKLAGTYMILSTVYSLHYRLEAAEVAIRKAIAIDANFYEAHVVLVKLLIDAERLDEAEKAARTAIVISPDRAGAYLHLANILFRRGHVSEARKMVDKVATIQTGSLEFFEIGGDVLLCLGRYLAAGEKFLAALQAAPDRFIFHQGMGFCLKAGKYTGITGLADTARWIEKIESPAIAAAVDYWLAAFHPEKAAGKYRRFLQAISAIAGETIENPNPAERRPFAADAAIPEKAVAMLTFARSATGFFHSIFDGHPQITTLPGYYLKGFFGKGLWEEISSQGYQKMAERFSSFYPVLFDAACSAAVPGHNESSLGIAEGFTQMGDDRNQTLTLDKDRFEFAVKEMLVQRKNVNQGEFFSIIHRAFDVARQRPTAAGLIFYHIHNATQWELGNFCRHFPDAKLLLPTRNPIQGLESWLYTPQVNDVVFEYQVCIEKIVRILFDIDRIQYVHHDAMGIRLEDLKGRQQDTIAAICRWLDISGDASLYQTTMQGLKLWGDCATSKTIREDPFNKSKNDPTQRKLGRFFSRRDQLIIGTLFYPFCAAFGYVAPDDRKFKHDLKKIRPMIDEPFDFERRFFPEILKLNEWGNIGFGTYFRAVLADRWAVLAEHGTYPGLIRPLLPPDGSL